MISFTGLNGDALFLGAVLGIAGILFWWHEHHWQRFTVWLLAASAACFTIAIPQVFEALAALTATQTRLLVLTVLDMAVFVAFYLQAIRTHKKSRFGGLLRRKGSPAANAVAPVSRPNRFGHVVTPLVAIMFGPLIVITFGSWRILTERVSVSVAGTMKALAQSAAAVNNGSAARAIPHANLQHTWITLIVVVLVIGLILRMAHKRKGGKGRGNPAMGGAPSR